MRKVQLLPDPQGWGVCVGGVCVCGGVLLQTSVVNGVYINVAVVGRLTKHAHILFCLVSYKALAAETRIAYLYIIKHLTFLCMIARQAAATRPGYHTTMDEYLPYRPLLMSINETFHG